MLQYGCNFITECDSVLVVHRMQGAYAEMFPGVSGPGLVFVLFLSCSLALVYMVPFIGSCNFASADRHCIGIGILVVGLYWI